MAQDKKTGFDDQVELHYSHAQIELRLKSLAEEIAADLPPDLVVIAILKGSFIFAADLIRALHHAGMTPEVDFMFLASYHGATSSSGEISVIRDPGLDLTGRDVLIIDDILESGRTLEHARQNVAAAGAQQVKTCVLINKDVPRAVAIDADYSGFICDDIFLVGYGMDYDHQFRQLPYIGEWRGQ